MFWLAPLELDLFLYSDLSELDIVYDITVFKLHNLVQNMQVNIILNKQVLSYI